MTTVRTALVALQAATFLGLGCVLLAAAHWKLGLAQILLCAVTVLVYA